MWTHKIFFKSTQNLFVRIDFQKFGSFEKEKPSPCILHHKLACFIDGNTREHRPGSPPKKVGFFHDLSYDSLLSGEQVVDSSELSVTRMFSAASVRQTPCDGSSSVPTPLLALESPSQCRQRQYRWAPIIFYMTSKFCCSYCFCTSRRNRCEIPCSVAGRTRAAGIAVTPCCPPRSTRQEYPVAVVVCSK